MAAPAFRYVSLQEYERLERTSETKAEWHDGEVVAMAGGSANHGRPQMRLRSMLDTARRRAPCEPFGADTRIRTDRMVAYPDASLAFGDAIFDPAEPIGTLVDPLVVFEILSPSTERYDRGRKFKNYQEILSLTDFVLIERDEMRVDHFRRAGDQWVLTPLMGPEAVLVLPDQEISIPLAELYERVEFPPEPQPEPDIPQG